MKSPEPSNFDVCLQQRLDEIHQQGLHRQLRRVDSPQSACVTIAGRDLLNFSSNDYLGLANHPLLKEAAIKAVEKFGCGSGAARLICGSLAPHHELETQLAHFKNTEAALSFSSGYAAAVGTICALVGKDDIVIIDKLVHASIVDAARLSGAKMRVFAHNNVSDLEEILKWAQERRAEISQSPRPQILIVTESIFSMDGDFAPLREIVALKQEYDAWLMVDEAHATGLLGNAGRGLAEDLGVSNQIEIQMGTLGKALGSAGGFIAGSRLLVDFLINRARSFVFSTAPVPAAAAAAQAAIELVQAEEGENRRRLLWSLVDELRSDLKKNGWPINPDRSAIIPLIIGDETAAVNAATALRDSGILIPAVRYPTVARGSARLRLTLTAGHNQAELRTLAAALGTLTRPSPATVSHA